ncbi:hypothetical protein [Rhizobium ruizarguesonis]|uniref:hypothetical protein n=1 Tax=Rhizobium ruizarguesonis TaxID=2081791 RepID=UPI001031A6E9|nr:hypothetical protein [Rhizobium ruizarguesonis]TAZ23406.1 hypothetical protein ELH74_37760 [Rhizobium ruizarguesonis]TBD07713.1 hypothetical protein ELH23_39040 [Rhizobium ruizarguesonis]
MDAQILSRLVSARSWATYVSDVLFRTRGFFAILMIAGASGSILAWMEQGQDLLRAVTDVRTGFSWPIVWLLIAVTGLAFQAWFWARVIVEEEFKEGAWRDNTYLRWAPRVLGLLPFVLLFVALFNLHKSVPVPACVLAAVGLVFLMFVWSRVPITSALRRKSNTLRSTGNGSKASIIDAVLDSLRKIVLATSVLYAAGAMFIVWLFPVGPAVFFGPAAVVLTACALIVPVFTSLLLVGSRFHLRVGTTLLVIVVIVSLLYDNHAIRLTHTAPVRTDLKAAYETWKAQAGPAGNGKIPMIFVASAGGASRAGYWTAAVLSQLETDTKGEFSRHVFAISSISGGSLGVGGFLASIRDGKIQNAVMSNQTTLRTSVSDFVGQDYLSPAVAGLLFTDLLQRFVPFPIFSDRAEALERGWEQGWAAHCANYSCDDPELFQENFLSLWQSPPRWMPVWMIGGALQQDGRPVLTSNVKFGDAIDAWDFHSLTGSDVRLSTAISNGARFPFVSPGGRIDNPKVPEAISTVHVVDGGYFDAAGVETVRELAQAMFALGGIVTGDDRIEPIFLLISNDGINPPFETVTGEQGEIPSLPFGCRGQATRSGCPGTVGFSRVATDLFGPIQGLYRSRSAHGERLKALLYSAPPQALQPEKNEAAQPATDVTDQVKKSDFDKRVFTLDLCSAQVPMNWALSETARDLVDGLLPGPIGSDRQCEHTNEGDFRLLLSKFAPATSDDALGKVFGSR